MIRDLHCHLSQALPGESPAEKARYLIEVGQRLGIGHFCLFMGYPFLTNPSPADLRRQNDQVLEAVSAHPDQLTGFVYLSGEHVAASLEELNRCVRDGPMRGIKLWVARRCSDPAMDPIFRRAEELNVVVFQHTWLKVSGQLPGESTPDDVAALGARFPGMKLICGHAGGDWERGIAAIRQHPQIHLGIGGSDPTAGFVEMAVRELGAARIVWGSDAPGRSFASQLAKVSGARIDEAAKRLILGDNLARLLQS
ncbi:MAG: amidohydrolase family protein [Verrucomicrobiales bacterium]|nr:amidohydrolase family protein [Verrucomicrobiae bacterium]MCP5554982.1 amidohydrolase family protein [Akkermansiaceae bacterium]